MRADYGTVTFSEWQGEGFLGVQIDPLGDGGVPAMQTAHSYGFLARPHDPGADGVGCTVERRRYGSEHFCWLGDDPRSVGWLPRLEKGGSAQYGGSTGRSLTWREIDGETGSVIDYVPVAWGADGVATKAHKIEAGVDGSGAPVVQIVHADGMQILLFEGGVVVADATGGGYVEVRGGTVTLNGSTKVVGGLDVGGTGGLPVARAPELIVWATEVNAALAGLGLTLPPLAPTVASTMAKTL
jgi:hypothetical protein